MDNAMFADLSFDPREDFSLRKHGLLCGMKFVPLRGLGSGAASGAAMGEVVGWVQNRVRLGQPTQNRF